MANEGGNEDGAAAALRSYSHNDREIKEAGDISYGVDSISLLPDVILHVILSFLPTTKIAIRTSILSKRWRHVWSDTPCLSFGWTKGDSINKTLDRYTARKMMSFELYAHRTDQIPYIDRWIEFAMSRNVENMWLNLCYDGNHKYHVPDFFYINNSVKQISVHLWYSDLTIPSCSVSWTSLKMLSLRFCNLYDECINKILSGCPILESLTLYFCEKLIVLDLRKSLRLRTLEISSNTCDQGPTMQIVAPHIHCLRLTNSQLPCTLVDVSSLKEARLDIYSVSLEEVEADVLQVTVLKMLEKLQNVDKLTFGGNFLKILSLAELRCVPFPSFKVKDLTLRTVISKYVIPGIVRVLQNSPELKKITTIHTMFDGTIPEGKIDNYLELQGLNRNQCWSLETRVFENMRHWKNVELKHVASFMELMFKNTKKLEKMVVRFECYLQDGIFEELLEMVPMLSHNNNVSIVLSSSQPNQRVFSLGSK